jgi:formate dehydrogenase subunit gamma
VIHAVIAMLFIAAMMAHIYIGSIGMEGAFDAMGTGEVDLNWAREHHSLWVEEELAKGHAPPGSIPRAMPAE